MKNHRFIFAGAALGLFPLLTVHAALDAGIVPGYARWVVYADLNGLRGSTVGKELIGMAEKAQQEKTGGQFGVDIQKLFETVGSITAYGANFSHDPQALDGALVAQGTPDLCKIAEAMLVQATITTPDRVSDIKGLPFPAYLAGKENDPKKLEVIIAFPPQPIILVSKSREQLLHAWDAFRGRGKTLKDADSPLHGLLANGHDALLFGASVAPNEKIFNVDGPEARILQMANAGSLALGESGENTFARAELIASSEEMADKVMKILQGLTAMLSLAETNEHALGEFLNSAKIGRDADKVSLSLIYPSTRLVAMVKNIDVARHPAMAKDPAAVREAQLTNGTSVGTWMSEAVEGSQPPNIDPKRTHTIENVALKNGSIITLAREGGRNVRFDRIEITPAGGGAPLVFTADFMRQAGPRGNWWELQFPGVDGQYDLLVGYLNDISGKTEYAVSVREPRHPRAGENAAKPDAGGDQK